MLAVGQHVKIVFKNVNIVNKDDKDEEDEEYFFPLCRTPSTYGYHTSNFSTKNAVPTEFVVDSIDYESYFFQEKNVRCIALRNPNIPEDSHFYDYVLTTDGYVRECECFGLTGMVVDSIEILPFDFNSIVPGMRVCFDVEEIPPRYSLPYTPSLLPEDHTSDVTAKCLEVDSIHNGLIALREPQFNKENHVYFWFLGTDGIIVQCDVYDPLFKVTNVRVL
jgi:hypothetical protein